MIIDCKIDEIKKTHTFRVFGMKNTLKMIFLNLQNQKLIDNIYKSIIFVNVKNTCNIYKLLKFNL